jgi:Tat protein translocase TatB subunit
MRSSPPCDRGLNRAQVGSDLVSIDPEKLLFIFVIAVLVLGPERLPQAARTLGRGLAEIRKYTSGFQSEVRQVLAEPKAIIDAAVREADLRTDRPRTNGAGTPRTDDGVPSAGSASAAGMDGAGDGAGRERRRPEPFTDDLRTAAVAGAPDDPALN